MSDSHDSPNHPLNSHESSPSNTPDTPNSLVLQTSTMRQPLERAERLHLRRQETNHRAWWSNSLQRRHESQLVLNDGHFHHIRS